MTFRTFQRSRKIKEHVDNFLLRNKGTVEYCIMKIKGETLTTVGSKGTSTIPLPFFWRPSVLRPIGIVTASAELTHLM